MASFSIYMSKQFIPCQCNLLAIKCLFFFFIILIYVHNFYTLRRTGDELGLDYEEVWEQTAGETKWRRTISSFPTRKSFSQVSCPFSVNACMWEMATKLRWVVIEKTRTVWRNITCHVSTHKRITSWPRGSQMRYRVTFERPKTNLRESGKLILW